MKNVNIINIFKKDYPSAVKIDVKKPSFIFRCRNCKSRLIPVDLWYKKNSAIILIGKDIHKGIRHYICPKCRNRYKQMSD